VCGNTSGKKKQNSSAVPWLDITARGIKLEAIDTDSVCVYVCSARYYQLSLSVIMDSAAVCVQVETVDTRRIGIRNVMRFAPNRAEN
jgi:hypothetical protein